MDRLEEILLDRTISSFPISISTASVLEAIFEPLIDPYDVEKVPDKKIRINSYRYHYYNVYTMLRNIIDSISTKNRDILLKYNIIDVLVKTLQKELFRITDLYSNTKCKPILYIPNYKDYMELPSLKEVGRHTKEYRKQLKIEETVSYLRKNRVLTDIEVLILDKNKLPDTKYSLITTHYPVDLLHTTDTCKLLESHTGKLKDKTEFNSRYSKLSGFDNTILPFNHILLYTLGDNGTIIRGVNVSIKRAILRIAYEKRWLPYTKLHHVKHDLRDILKQLKEEDRRWKQYL